MRDFRFCIALRHADGSLDEPVHEEIIFADNAIDAIAWAQAVYVDMFELKANAVYLVDPDGHAVWSLRLADSLPGSGLDRDRP